MPREYTPQSGPASPSPMSIGSTTDLNLPTPTYQAQTNVNPGVNVFAELNQILGLGAQAASSIFQYKTNRIKEQLSQLENERAEERYARSEERYEQSAAKEAEREAKQAAYDAIVAEKANESAKISDSFSANDIDSLVTNRAYLIREMNKATDPARKQALSNLVDEATTKIGMLQGKEESDNKILSTANAQNIYEMTLNKGQVFIDMYKSDPGLVDALSQLGADTVRKSVKDKLVEYLEAQPEFSGMLGDGSLEKEELQAMDKALNSIVDPITDQIVEIKNTRAKNTNAMVTSDALKLEASQGNIDRALEMLDETADQRTPRQEAAAIKGIGDNFIAGAKEGTVDRLNRSTKLFESTDPTLQRIGAAALSKEIGRIKTDLEIKRSSVDTSTLDPFSTSQSDQYYGWRNTYDSYDDLQAEVLSRKFGIDPETPIEALPEPAKNVVEYLQESWNADTKRTEEAMRSAERRLKMSDEKSKKTLSSGDVWKETTLGLAFEDGSWKKFNPVQMQQALKESTIGFKDGSIPDQVIAAIKNTGDPESYLLIKEFWDIHGPGQNPEMAVKVASDTGLRDSMLVGIYLNTRLSDPRTAPSQLGTETSQFVENLKYLTNPSIVDPKDKKAVEIRDRVVTVMDSMMSSDGSGRLGWADGLGFSKNTMIGTMDPADVGILTHYSAMSAALDSSTDRQAFLRRALEVEGYEFYVSTDKTKVDMVWNGTNRNNEKTLPSTTVIESDSWKTYMKEKAIEWVDRGLSQRMTIEGVDNPYAGNAQQLREDIRRGAAKIDIIPSPLDMYNGFCVYQIKLPNGDTYRTTPMEQSGSVDASDYKAWSSKQKTSTSTQAPSLFLLNRVL